MSWRNQVQWCLFALTAALLTACSDDGGAGSTGDAEQQSAPWSEQQDVDKDAWEQELKADAKLAAAAAAVTLPWQAAGRIEDEAGAQVLWAEYAADPNDARSKIAAIVKSCSAAGECKIALGSYNEQGASLMVDGVALEKLAVGTPNLNKKLKTSNSDGGTVIAHPLSRKAVVDPALAKFHIDNGSWGKRRLLLINRFGRQMGVDLKTIESAAKATGLFDEVQHVQYARRRDVDLWLPQLNALDVVIWVAAGVVKPFGGKPHRAVGMTVSRGVVGDELYHSKSLGKLLEAPPLGGPGLVILAGGNSLTANKSTSDVLAKSLNLLPYRPVVGVQGHISLAQAETSVAALLSQLSAGATLEKALEAANERSGDGTFLTTLSDDLAETWTLPAATTEFWGGAAPTSASLKLFVKVDPLCADVSSVGGKCTISTLQQGTPIDPTKITPILDTRFMCEPTFSGPYFNCEVDNPTIKAKFWLKGLLTGRSVGASVLVHAQGQGDGKVKDFAVTGAGVVEMVDEGGGSTKLAFGGPAAGGTFWNQDGQCCIAKTPLLTGHASNLLSTLEIKP